MPATSYLDRPLLANLGAIVRGAGRITRRAVATAAQRLDGRGGSAPVTASQELPSILPQVRGGQLGELNEWNAGQAIAANTGHVYSAVSFTENQIRSVTKSARLLAHVRGDDTPDEVTEHYILDTLRSPNTMETGPELNGRVSAWLQLAGYAVLVKVRDNIGRVIALWPLQPELMRFVAGTMRPVDGVMFFPQGFNGKGVAIPREDCVIFRQPSAAGSLYGWATLRAAALEKDISDKALRMRLAWFDNQARPDYVLAPKLPQGKDRQTTLARFWANLMIHHQGIEKYGMPLVVPEGTEVTTLSFSAEALQLIEQLNLTRDNIFEFFGVSALLMGHTESIPARATLEAELLRYAKFKGQPTLDLIQSAYQRDLIDAEVNPLQQDGVRLELAYDSLIERDRAFDQATAIQGYKGEILTLNQALELLGQPPVPGAEGDARKQTPAPPDPFGGMAPDVAPGEPKSLASLDREAIEAIVEAAALKAVGLARKDAAPETRVAREVTHPTLDTEEKRADWWAKAIKPQDENTARATRVMRGFFRSQADRVLPAIEPHVRAASDKFHGVSRHKVLRWFAEVERKGEWDAVLKMGKDEPGGWDGKDEARALEDALRPVANRAADDGGKLLARQLGLAWDIENPQAQRWLDGHIARTASDITDTTAAAISGVIRDGVADGLSTGEIMRGIRAEFDKWAGLGSEGEGRTQEPGVMPGYRAARIARTEIGTAFGFGQQEALTDAAAEGIVESKMWISARDEHVRTPPESDFNHKIDGETATVDGTFSNGLRFAGDPSGEPGNIINCRCTIAAVVARG